jgi:hypothetical protein
LDVQSNRWRKIADHIVANHAAKKTRKKHGVDTLFFPWDGRTTFGDTSISISFGETAVV